MYTPLDFPRPPIMYCQCADANILYDGISISSEGGRGMRWNDEGFTRTRTSYSHEFARDEQQTIETSE